MRKLAAASASLALAVFLSYYLLPRESILPAAAVCLTAAAVSALLRRQSRTVRRIFLCLLGASIGFAAYALHWNRTLRYAEAWDGTEQILNVQVMESPVRLDYSTRIHVRRTEKPRLDMMLYDYNAQAGDLVPGNVLTVDAKLRRADLRYGERSDSLVSKDIYLTGTLAGIENRLPDQNSIRTLAARCAKKLSDFAGSFFSPDTAVFMRSLMLGDKTDFYQDTTLYARMRGAGFMHVVAVSGMHIAFLVGMIQLLFGARPLSSVAGILLVCFFVFMTGASPSAVRAGIMQTLLLMAPIFRRENDGPTSLAFALAAILLMNPFSCASISLQLSFSAMAGMVLLAEPMTLTLMKACRADRESWLWAPLSVIGASLAVLIMSAPFSVIHFGSLAVYSPLTNLLGLWAVSLCFCGGYLSCFAALLFLPLGKLLAVPTQPLARYLILLAGLICRIPHHLLPMQTAEMKVWLALCYALGLIAWRSRAGSRFRLLVPAALSILTLAAVISLSARRYRSAEAVLAALDVGQGECICAVSADNTLMFDCGGLNTLDNAGETAGAWLEHAGRKQLDALVLSHLHEDHANGVPMLLELIPVHEIILSPNADTDEQLLTRIVDAAERKGTKVTRLLENTERTFGRIRVRMTAPPDAGDENERCIISLVSIGDYDMLITGDSPASAEQRLIENEQIPDTELLIVGHHGSKTSSDRAFLSAIQAEDAIISVGKNNSYGHPTRETLASLQICGYGIYRTDLNGTVEVWLQTA